MDKVTVANFINLANNMVGSGLIPTGEANYELAKEYATQQSRIDAINFYNWIENENTIWHNEQEEPLTDDELYELYQSQKPKQ